MEEISLSYVLTTFNKLPYLKFTLPALIAGCKADEEIIVTDGGSKDGSKEFIEGFFKEGKIHQFVSEPDKGEAHGYNKAILMARGKLIKIISDDDAYDYDEIDKCKQFMLSHPEVDALGTDGYNINLQFANSILRRKDDAYHYRLYQERGTPFIITGLSLLLRKSSLPLIGLFHTSFMIIDFEYSLRLTAGKANVAFYTGCSYCNIANADSNSNKYWKRLRSEKKRLQYLYHIKTSPVDREAITYCRSVLSERVKKMLGRQPKQMNLIPYEKSFIQAQEILKEFAAGGKGRFLVKNTN